MPLSDEPNLSGFNHPSFHGWGKSQIGETEHFTHCLHTLPFTTSNTFWHRTIYGRFTEMFFGACAVQSKQESFFCYASSVPYPSNTQRAKLNNFRQRREKRKQHGCAVLRVAQWVTRDEHKTTTITTTATILNIESRR